MGPPNSFRVPLNPWQGALSLILTNSVDNHVVERRDNQFRSAMGLSSNLDPTNQFQTRYWQTGEHDPLIVGPFAA